ncbi:GDSL family lipase [Bacillus sp. M6-12]|uniref:SGNH/GDSL hydrolase family protein n=1 Tax=Bacillus sp. M6-12 TaxID=2054166 RepID=UPI000C755ACB|nr:SGNH/GDSL hydrolase family protein [Bacillus sp. M6-12]PLS16253.1 GDSL family lipase [Bacillus sp. M6-12]
MFRKIVLLIICTATLASCTRQAEVVKEEPKQQQKSEIGLQTKEAIPASFFPAPLKVVAIGDSLTEGVGSSHKNGGYLPYLKSLLEEETFLHTAQISNYGKKGNRTDQLLRRLNNPELKQEIAASDAVIITIGGNDVMKVVRENIMNLQMEQFVDARIDYETRLKEIIAKVRSNNPNTEIYLVGLYNPFSKFFSELDEIMGSWNSSSEMVLAEFENTHFIQIGDVFKNSKEDLLFTEDYFHPNDRGYELIAAQIYKQMEEYSIKEYAYN